ncbi:helix-turn-helix domain-containing protein [Rhizobium leguminosarum]|uniref:helix-turn-helix domain-containing protein n=1 Tax=Rhizobium leguminosarum TaxID=384 RepID=UPI001FDEA7E3|nr:helix-turn-helix domain-containing protein [Rhizobium leguminosarum]
MGKPHLIELRARVVAFVKQGHSHREAARHFRVSPRFVNNMIILEQSSGSLAPPKQGHPLVSRSTAPRSAGFSSGLAE